MAAKIHYAHKPDQQWARCKPSELENGYAVTFTPDNNVAVCEKKKVVLYEGTKGEQVGKH